MSPIPSAITRRQWIRQAAGLAGSAAASSLLPAAVEAAQVEATADASITWISTTATAPWQSRPLRPLGWQWDTLDAWVDPSNADARSPSIQGCGACFNELGWTSLQSLPDDQRESIFKELFAPGWVPTSTFVACPSAPTTSPEAGTPTTKLPATLRSTLQHRQ